MLFLWEIPISKITGGNNMNFIKKIITIGCLSVLLICGRIGSADAYTAEVEYFFQGLNIDTGEVFTDPTMMIIVAGIPGDRIEKLLKPPEEIVFDHADLYFEFDPTLGTSLVLTLEGLRNIVGLTVNGVEIEIPEDLDEFFAVPIDNDDIITLRTAEGKEFELTVNLPSTLSAPVIISAVSGGPDPGPNPDPAVPEPSTLMLFAGGLLGLLGLRRWKKSGKRGIKRLLFLTAMVGMTGVFVLSGAQPVFAQFCSTVTEIPQAECQALVALYTSTNGDNWSDNTGWLQTTMPCSWNGVTCDTGHVVYMILNNNQLSGSIPPEIGNLANLYRLELYNNQLNGSIPPEIGNLSNLYRLELYNNQLSGSIPPKIGNLSNLAILSLSNNQLSGSIPPELGALVGGTGPVLTFDLSNNQLGGSIPPELGNLNVTMLRLDNNQLSGSIPPEIGNLNGIITLRLDNNPLSGALPANVLNLSPNPGFSFNNTNVCEPQDAAFQAWLASIPAENKTGIACSSFDYFVYDEYGGSPQDVDKTPQTGDDEQMCWNFSGSNILHWTGWNVLDTAQDISENVKSYWTNAGGMMKYLWRWWIDGSSPPDLGADWSMLTAIGGGDHWENYDFSDYYYSHWHKNVMAAVKGYLHNGYGVSVRLYDNEDSQNGEHALTVWGYRFYEDGTVFGVWVTDSDDAASEPPELRLLPVTYTAKWINSTLYELKWRVADDAQAEPYRNWLIEGVQALKPQAPNSLGVHKAGTGTGRVLSTPAGIVCGESCVSPYLQGTQVTLTATPKNEAVFVGWQGACSGSGDCVVTVDEEQIVTALFESTESAVFTITTDVEAGVSLYPTGTVHDVPAGVAAKFVFTPDAEHNILDVLVDGYSVGPVTTYTFTDIAADHTLHVKTIPKDAKLAITHKKCVEIDADGNVLYDENGEEKEIACIPGDNATIYVGDQVGDSECMQMIVPFTDGTALILRAVPDESNRFLRWEINGEPIGPENEDRIRYTLEDIFLEPVIGCSHN